MNSSLVLEAVFSVQALFSRGLLFFSSFGSVFLRFARSLPLKRQPSQYGGQRAEDQGEAAGVSGRRGPVAAAAQFEQAAAEVQVAGLLLQLLPQVGGSLLAVGQR